MKAYKIIFTSVLALLTAAALAIGILNGIKLLSLPEFFSTAKEEARIPGLSQGFVPEGICECPDGILVAGYMSDGTASRVYLIKDSGVVSCTRLNNEDFTPFTQRVGSIAYSGDFIYVTGDDGLCCFFYCDIAEGFDTAEQFGVINTFVSPKWCTVDGERIYVGSDDNVKKYDGVNIGDMMYPIEGDIGGTVVAFAINDELPYGINPRPLFAILTPKGVEGGAFTNDFLLLSTSDGLAPSEISLYGFVEEKENLAFLEHEISSYFVPLYYLDTDSPIYSIDTLPMTEELFVRDGRALIINSSASSDSFVGRLYGGESIYSFELPKVN